MTVAYTKPKTPAELATLTEYQQPATARIRSVAVREKFRQQIEQLEKKSGSIDAEHNT